MRRLFLLMWALVLMLATPALAEDDTDAELITNARDMLAGIERDVAAFEQLVAPSTAVGSEERALLERRKTRAGSEVLARINEFVAAVVELERGGSQIPDLREAAAGLVLKIDPLARKRIEDLNAEIRALGIERDRSEGDARDLLEARIARRAELLRTVFQATFQNLRNMGTLGLDATEPRAYLMDTIMNRAEDTLSRLEIEQGRIASLKDQLSANPTDAERKGELDAAEARRAVSVTDLTITIDMMRELGLDATKYKQALIGATGEISTDILDVRVAFGLARKWLTALKDQVVERGPGWAFKLLVISAILLLFHFLGRVVQRIVRRVLTASRLRLSQLLSETIVATAGNLVRALGVLIALSQIGFALGPVLAGLGIAGFIAGFALQETLANFASGVMILVYRPFDIGDSVEAGGAAGTVSAMSLVSTRILTGDNQALVVPNGKIWGGVIKNVTAEKTLRVNLSVRVHYGEGVEKIERILADVAASHPKVLKDPAATVKLHAMADASLDFIVWAWVRTPDYQDVHWDLTRAIKLAFDKEGVRAALPQCEEYRAGSTKGRV